MKETDYSSKDLDRFINGLSLINDMAMPNTMLMIVMMTYINV